MAIRLEKSVVCGEIDSTAKGTVRCVLWLVDRPEPLVVTLEGDPWRDVAGTKVIFENKNPAEEASVNLLHSEQVGTVGDITASRKVKHLLLQDNSLKEIYSSREPIPIEWRNSLYLEWFSTKNGRVLIESSEYLIRIGEPVWTLDEADEQAQKLSNQYAMRNFLNSVIRRDEESDGDEDAEDEEAWERRLEANDRLTDAHLEALEKYDGDPEEVDKTSFAMGWDHLLDGGDVEDTSRPWLDDFESIEGDEWKDENDSAHTDEGDDDDFSEPRTKHPLQQRTSALAVTVMHFSRLGDSDERSEEPDSAINRFARLCLQISGNCAGVLSSLYSSHPMPRGMILATLKRCVKWADEALSALEEISSTPTWHPHRAMAMQLRKEIEEIRMDIVSTRSDLGAS